MAPAPEPAAPRGPIVFVATCAVCGAEVWTYRRLGGVSMIGPHRDGPRRPGRLRPFCTGGGLEVPA